ncbi:MAG: hypothetical protein ABIZ80_06145 [Bryobacteraceae bacterium]
MSRRIPCPTCAILTLLALNAYIIWPLAGAGVIAELQANGLNYASISRILLDHPADPASPLARLGHRGRQAHRGRAERTLVAAAPDPLA